MPSVTFEVSCSTEHGERVLVVGGHPNLGSWEPNASKVELMTNEHSYPVWRARSFFQPGEQLVYKYVVLAGDGQQRWEEALENRRLDVGQQDITLKHSFDSPQEERELRSSILEPFKFDLVAMAFAQAAAAPQQYDEHDGDEEEEETDDEEEGETEEAEEDEESEISQPVAAPAHQHVVAAAPPAHEPAENPPAPQHMAVAEPAPQELAVEVPYEQLDEVNMQGEAQWRHLMELQLQASERRALEAEAHVMELERRVAERELALALAQKQLAAALGGQKQPCLSSVSTGSFMSTPDTASLGAVSSEDGEDRPGPMRRTASRLLEMFGRQGS